MKKNKRPKFLPFKWLIFEIDNNTCIGYTFYDKSVGKVMYVSDNLESNILEFNNIANPRILSVTSKSNMKLAELANMKPEQVALWVKADC